MRPALNYSTSVSSQYFVNISAYSVGSGKAFLNSNFMSSLGNISLRCFLSFNNRMAVIKSRLINRSCWNDRLSITVLISIPPNRKLKVSGEKQEIKP